MSGRSSLVVALLVAVFSSGCGSSNKSQDQALAERAVLRSSDLPGGTGGGGQGWYVEKVDDKSVAGACVDFEVPGLTATGHAHSKWFSSPASWLRDWQAASFSAVYKNSADRALQHLAVKTTQCIREKRASADDLTTGLPTTVTKVRRISFPQIGENSRAYEIKSGTGFAAIYDYAVLVRRGRALILLYVVSGSSASHVQLMVKFAQTISSRMS